MFQCATLTAVVVCSATVFSCIFCHDWLLEREKKATLILALTGQWEKTPGSNVDTGQDRQENAAGHKGDDNIIIVATSATLIQELVGMLSSLPR